MCLGASGGLNPSPLPLRARVQDILGFEGYCAPVWKTLLYWALCVLTGGAAFLACQWYLGLRLLLAFQACPLASADHVVVTVRQRLGEGSALPCLGALTHARRLA